MEEINYSIISQVSSLESLLVECGVNTFEDKGDYISFSSPFREDKRPSAVVYKDSLVTVDFGGDFRGHFSYFFYKVTGINLFKFLKLNSSSLLESIYFKENKKEKPRDAFVPGGEKEFKIIGGEIQYDFSKNLSAMAFARRRFLTEDFREAFKIGFCTNLKMAYAVPEVLAKIDFKMTPFINRVCIPIYEDYKLVSYEGRDFTGYGEPKVLYPKGGSVSSLFNHEFLNKKEPLVVVEGIMDMPRIWQHITKNVTTTFGINVSPKQKRQLKEFDKVILFSDTDKAGKKMIDSFELFMEKPFWVARLKKGDPGDRENSLGDLEEAIYNAKESVEFFLDESGLFEKKEVEGSYFS